MRSGPDGGLRARIVKRLAHFDLDVTLECGPGELVALVGPSGSGKTTALRCLAGLEVPDGGEIAFAGATWSRGRTILRTVQKRRVGLLAQDAPLFPHMTVLRNVAFALSGGGDPLRLLTEMGIDHLRDRRPHQLSGGERQRAALCQVLAGRPGLLLLDEPFSALDVENRLALRDRLLALRDEWGVPVVHVTHDLEEAAAIADRVVSLRGGREDPDWLERQLDLLRSGTTPPGFRAPCPRPPLAASAGPHAGRPGDTTPRSER